eukprot:1161079-Pelagomonas_calceolata.AAC.6
MSVCDLVAGASCTGGGCMTLLLCGMCGMCDPAVERLAQAEAALSQVQTDKSELLARYAAQGTQLSELMAMVREYDSRYAAQGMLLSLIVSELMAMWQGSNPRSFAGQQHLQHCLHAILAASTACTPHVALPVQHMQLYLHTICAAITVCTCSTACTPSVLPAHAALKSAPSTFPFLRLPQESLLSNALANSQAMVASLTGTGTPRSIGEGGCVPAECDALLAGHLLT